MLEIRVVCSELLAFKYVFIVFLNNSDDCLWLQLRNLENSRLKLVFRCLHNIHLYLCGQVENIECILYVQSKNRF